MAAAFLPSILVPIVGLIFQLLVWHYFSYIFKQMILLKAYNYSNKSFIFNDLFEYFLKILKNIVIYNFLF